MHDPSNQSHARLHLRPLLAALLAVFALAGCTQVRITDPPKTATEQFLMSVASSEAVDQLEVDALRGRRVYVDGKYFASIANHDFLVGEIRAKLLREGAQLMETRASSEVVLELRSAGVGIDRYEFLLGLPAIPLGTIAGATTDVAAAPALATPELSLVKNVKQLGLASVSFVAYWTDTGEFITGSGPATGVTRRSDWWFFGAGPRTQGNIPPVRVLQELEGQE